MVDDKSSIFRSPTDFHLVDWVRWSRQLHTSMKSWYMQWSYSFVDGLQTENGVQQSRGLYSFVCLPIYAWVWITNHSQWSCFFSSAEISRVAEMQTMYGCIWNGPCLMDLDGFHISLASVLGSFPNWWVDGLPGGGLAIWICRGLSSSTDCHFFGSRSLPTILS